MPRTYVTTPILRRLFQRVERTATGCLEWRGSTNGRYGKILIRKIGRTSVLDYVHRVAFKLYFREIPAGMQVLHRCDNPICVARAHLFAGTQLENLEDAERKKRLERDPRTGKMRRGPALSPA